MVDPGQPELVNEIERFRLAIKEYAAGRNCHIDYDSKSKRFRVFLSVSERHVDLAKRTVDDFGHLISVSFINERMPIRIVEDQLRQFKFPQYRSLLENQLRDVVTRQKGQVKEIFCLNVHVDLGNHYAFITFSSSEWRASFVKQKMDSLQDMDTRDRHYWQIYYSFFAYEERVEVSGEIANILGKHEETIESSYDRYGEKYLQEMSNAYAYCMIDATTSAINNIADEFAPLTKSDDFVSAMILGDESSNLQDLALRRTVSVELLNSVFSPTLGIPV